MVSFSVMIENLKLLDIVMLIMLEILIHVNQLLIMCSTWVLEQFHGVVRDNQQCHCQVRKQSTEHQQWQHENVYGLPNY